MSTTPIFYVDDEESDLVLFRELMELCDHAGPVSVFRTGPEVLAALAALPEDAEPPIVISDLNMVPMDGLTLLDRVTSDPRWHALPFFVISTSREDEEAARIRALGGAGFFAKSISVDGFISLVQQITSAAAKLKLRSPPARSPASAK